MRFWPAARRTAPPGAPRAVRAGFRSGVPGAAGVRPPRTPARLPAVPLATLTGLGMAGVMVLSAPPAAAQATPGKAAREDGPGNAAPAHASLENASLENGSLAPASLENAGLVPAGVANAALAHAKLKSISPKHKSVQTATPAEVVLTFNERPKRDYTEVRVTGPADADAAGGEIAVSGERVRLPLRPLTEAGRYRVAYRTVSVDGHVISGEREFTFRPEKRPATAPKTEVSSPGATPGAGGAVGGAGQADEAGAGGSGSSPLVMVLLGGIVAALVTGGVVAFRRGHGDR